MNPGPRKGANPQRPGLPTPFGGETNRRNIMTEYDKARADFDRAYAEFDPVRQRFADVKIPLDQRPSRDEYIKAADKFGQAKVAFDKAFAKASRK